jgi:hypothetical protein
MERASQLPVEATATAKLTICLANFFSTLSLGQRTWSLTQDKDMRIWSPAGTLIGDTSHGPMCLPVLQPSLQRQGVWSQVVLVADAARRYNGPGLPKYVVDGKEWLCWRSHSQLVP